MNLAQLTRKAFIGISILLLENNTSFAAQEDPTTTQMYKMMKSLQAMYVQAEPSLFNLGKQITATNSPVYLQYSDNVPYRPDSRDPEPIIRKGFKIFTHATDNPTREVGYLIVGSTYHPLLNRPTIDLSWLYINESDRGKHYGSNAVRIFEGIFKNYTDKFPDAQTLSARTNKENAMMCHILEKAGWTQVADGLQPNMVDFKKARPKKVGGAK